MRFVGEVGSGGRSACWARDGRSVGGGSVGIDCSPMYEKASLMAVGGDRSSSAEFARAFKKVRISNLRDRTGCCQDTPRKLFVYLLLQSRV